MNVYFFLHLSHHQTKEKGRKKEGIRVLIGHHKRKSRVLRIDLSYIHYRNIDLFALYNYNLISCGWKISTITWCFGQLCLEDVSCRIEDITWICRNTRSDKIRMRIFVVQASVVDKVRKVKWSSLDMWRGDAEMSQWRVVRGLM